MGETGEYDPGSIYSSGTNVTTRLGPALLFFLLGASEPVLFASLVISAWKIGG
jgi:hypothetical protein